MIHTLGRSVQPSHCIYQGGGAHRDRTAHLYLCVLQVRAEITSKEKEEEDMMEKVQKEAKYETQAMFSFKQRPPLKLLMKSNQ